MTRNSNPVYKLWKNIKARKDVSMDPEWYNNFEVFEQAVGDRPTAKSALLRKNKSIGYVPGNVEWKDSKIGLRVSVKSKKLDNDKISENMSAREKLNLLADMLGPVPEHLRDKDPKKDTSGLDAYIKTFLDNRYWLHIQVATREVQKNRASLNPEQIIAIYTKAEADYQEWLQSEDCQECLKECSDHYSHFLSHH